jgi:hypothetical protein
MASHEMIAIDAVFRMWGKPARYTPPTGPFVDCRVIWNAPDLAIETLGGGRPILQGNVIQIRKSQVAAPMKGGTIAINGGTPMKIEDDPRHAPDDVERLVWLMTVR